MQKELEHESKIERVGIWDLLRLRDKSWKMPLIICVVVHAGMQFAGLNPASSDIGPVHKGANHVPKAVSERDSYPFLI